MPDPTLASLADFQAWAPIAAGREESLITDILESVTAAAQFETGRVLFFGTFTERLDGRGGFVISPKNTPILSVNSVTDRGVAIVESDGVTSGWVIGPESMYLQLIGRRFSDGPVTVVEYTGGFAAIPKDLKVGALHQAKYEYEERQHTGMTSKGLGTAQSGGFLNVPFVPIFQRALDRYKRVTY